MNNCLCTRGIIMRDYDKTAQNILIKLTSMINSGYFTSRHEILDWINQLLSLQLTKIEQLGSGSVYCQILDAAYPEKVPLNKVKWTAYLQVDFLHNFKVLQVAFERLGIVKVIETQKLVKAKYQDNLEFIQWMKWYFTPLIKENKSYNPQARRNHCPVYLLFTERKPTEHRPEVKESKASNDNKENKENKENMYKSVATKSTNNLLKSYRSVSQLKGINESLKPFARTHQKQQGFNFKKNKNEKHALQQKPKIVNIQSVQSDQECF